MNITFHGAAQEVTGSMHLLQVNEREILLDCGLLQGHRAETNQRNSHLPFEARQLDYMLLSHAHMDHCGNVPTLVKSGYAGQIVCTPATHDLARLMLRDSARIQEQDAEYWNAKHPGEPIQPLYGQDDAERAIRAITTRAYASEFDLDKAGARARFMDAGHILGSAITVLELDEGGRKTRFGFSGDLGRKGTLILRDPEPAPPLDYLILESTYGDRVHPAIDQSEQDLARIVGETSRRGGKTIIPAFALERTQEVVYSLHRSILAGTLEPLPIFVDSPLAIDATDVFRLHSEVFDDQSVERAGRHHLRERHGRGRTDPAPRQEQYRRRAEHDSLCGLPGGKHPRPPARGWREKSENIRRRVHRPGTY
jgi:metallo-beta-lactamase family protein